MRVLGVDPGSRFMGYGAVEERRGRLFHLDHGVIRGGSGQPLEVRLKVLFEGLTKVVRALRPEAVAVEGVFTLRNARSALVLGHARGIVLLVAAQQGLAVHEYAPARVKKAVGAGGGADKETVARRVRAFLQMGELERTDASDALAVALCHLNRSRLPVFDSAPVAKDWPERLLPAYRAP